MLWEINRPEASVKGNPIYEFFGVERYWRYNKPKMLELLKNGRIEQKKGELPYLKRYLDEMSGKQLQDIWIDIKPVHSKKMVYPTQKPEALLDRIVTCSSTLVRLSMIHLQVREHRESCVSNHLENG